MQSGNRGMWLTGLISDHDVTNGTASAVPAADERSDQPALAPGDDQPDFSDTTSILHGAAAITGKASWSAMRVAQANDALAFYETDRKLRLAREEQEARELAHLAEWNSQMTEVGGVRMTNAEAQASRRRVLADADAYADKAIANGEIEESDRTEFKRWTARKIELEDKRRRGTITKGEEAEEAQGDRSRVGHSVDGATGKDHQMQGAAPAAQNSAPEANAAVRADAGGGSALKDYAIFQARGPISPATGRETAAPVALNVQTTGLNL